MSAIAFTDDNGNAYYAQPEGGYGRNDPNPDPPIPFTPRSNLYANGNAKWDGGLSPVYIKQADGSWQNIGAPEHAESSYYVSQGLQDPQLGKLIELKNSAPQLLNNEQKAFFAGGIGSIDSLGEGYRWGYQNLFDNKFDPQQAGYLLQTGYSKYLSPQDQAMGAQFNQQQSPEAQSARAEAGKGLTGLGPLGDLAVLGGLGFVAGPAIANALGGGFLGNVGAGTILGTVTGKSPEDALLSSLLGAGISSGLSSLDVLPKELIPIASAATKAAVTGQDPLTAALYAVPGAYLSSAPSGTFSGFGGFGRGGFGSSSSVPSSSVDVPSSLGAPDSLPSNASGDMGGGDYGTSVIPDLPASTGYGSLIDQAALDQSGAGLLSGESTGVTVSPLTDVGSVSAANIPTTDSVGYVPSTESAATTAAPETTATPTVIDIPVTPTDTGVTVSPLADVGTVSATELPVTQTVADSGLGSVADQTASQAVTDAANVDLAGIGQQGWEALPGTTPYVSQSVVDAINSANLTNATNVDLAGIGQQGWEALPGESPYLPELGSLFDAQKALAIAASLKNAIGLLSGQNAAQMNAFKQMLQNKGITDAGASALSEFNKITGQGQYGDPTKRPFLAPSALSTGSPLQNVPAPGVDPRLMMQLLSRGYQVNAATGGSINPSRLVPGPEGRYYAKHDHRGFAVGGPGTGQSDDIPTMLSDGEYVIDADTVAALGDGSSKAGASVLDKFREEIRKHKRSAPTDDIPPKAKSPMQYLKMAHKGKHHG